MHLRMNSGKFITSHGSCQALLRKTGLSKKERSIAKKKGVGEHPHPSFWLLILSGRFFGKKAKPNPSHSALP
jgi:hypothetical protein